MNNGHTQKVRWTELKGRYGRSGAMLTLTMIGTSGEGRGGQLAGGFPGSVRGSRKDGSAPPEIQSWLGRPRHDRCGP
jgi:hypothetical protein